MVTGAAKFIPGSWSDCRISSMEPPGYQLHAWRGRRLVTHTGVFGRYAGPYPFHDPSGALLDGSPN